MEENLSWTRLIDISCYCSNFLDGDFVVIVSLISSTIIFFISNLFDRLGFTNFIIICLVINIIIYKYWSWSTIIFFILNFIINNNNNILIIVINVLIQKKIVRKNSSINWFYSRLKKEEKSSIIPTTIICSSNNFSTIFINCFWWWWWWWNITFTSIEYFIYVVKRKINWNFSSEIWNNIWCWSYL